MKRLSVAAMLALAANAQAAISSATSHVPVIHEVAAEWTSVDKPVSIARSSLRCVDVSMMDPGVWDSHWYNLGCN
jgi:hypothetical protein